MSEMIERVASAIALVMVRQPFVKADDVARAAIAAMREPTEAMIAAPASAGWEDEVRADYRAMIDAALTE